MAYFAYLWFFFCLFMAYLWFIYGLFIAHVWIYWLIYGLRMNICRLINITFGYLMALSKIIFG